MRDPVCSVDGLLPHPDLHPLLPHRGHLLGLLLAQPRRNAGQGRPRGHHGPHHDNSHLIHQLRHNNILILNATKLDKTLFKNISKHSMYKTLQFTEEAKALV